MDKISCFTPSYTGVRDPDNPGYTGYPYGYLQTQCESGISDGTQADSVNLSAGAQSQLK